MYVIRERLFRFKEDADITDESGRPVFHVDGKAFSLRNRLVVQSVDGRELAEVHRRMAALRPTYAISEEGRVVAEVRRKGLAPFGARFTVAMARGEDLTVTGDFMGHEFAV